jgi:PAS domain S-box-containing protein
MLRFRDRPIRQKLVIITMATTAAALLLAGWGIVTADSFLFRGYLRRDLSALARIIADNSTAALAFNDPEAAAQTLGSLRARTHVDGACIYRPDGTVLARYSPEGVFKCPAAESGQTIRTTVGHVTAWQPIILNGRRVGMLMLLYDLGEINERVRLYSATVFLLVVAASLFALLVSTRLRGEIATPIARLLSATTAVAETGDYWIRAEKLSGDEMGVLVDRFNEMLAGIQSRDGNLKKALLDLGFALEQREVALREAERERERFHFLAESMPQKIFTATPNGEVDYYNGQWIEYTGLTFDEMKDWGWTQFVHPDDVDENVRRWRHSVESGDPFSFEARFRRADGIYRWHLTRAHAMRDAAGNVTMWIGSNTEIQEQKEKEAELRRANLDLEQFAYSASHDLQEPIRNVAVYSEIVARRYEHVLDAQGKQFLGILREGGIRLATLVSDLLAYTRASMAELMETPVDSAAALRNSLANLSEAIRQSGAEVTYDALPEVFMGEAHLQQVFQNLVGNALKYRTELPPRIHISAERRGEFWRFSVTDNGIGIDPQYKEKIFGVFKRLHHTQQYSGTGIGLAICQRVVERYGGRIWVESEPGKGATFYFTVPRRAEAGRASKVQSSPG